jgi:hypothetical protein
VQPEAAQANQALFYDKSGTPYTSAQFVANMRDRVARAFQGIGATMPAGPVTLAGSTQPGTAADPAGAGASGWGTGTPKNRTTVVQQSMESVLDQVFTHADKATLHSGSSKTKNAHKLPEAVLSALQT